MKLKQLLTVLLTKFSIMNFIDLTFMSAGLEGTKVEREKFIIFYKLIMNRAQQKLKNYHYNKKQESWSSCLNSLFPEDAIIWRAAKRIRSSVTNFPPTLILNSQDYGYSDKEKKQMQMPVI